MFWILKIRENETTHTTPPSVPHCCYGNNSQPKHCHAAPLVHHVFTHHIAGVASLKSPDPISMSRGRVRDKKNYVEYRRENGKRSAEHEDHHGRITQRNS